MTITWDLILSACGGITAICVAVGWLYKIMHKVVEPGQKMEERLTAIESRLANHDELFDKDNRRLRAIEDGNRIIQKALLALLAHGIDGNETEALKTAKDELQRYLIER